MKAEAGGNRLGRARPRRHGEHSRLEALAEAALSLGEVAQITALCRAGAVVGLLAGEGCKVGPGRELADHILRLQQGTPHLGFLVAGRGDQDVARPRPVFERQLGHVNGVGDFQGFIIQLIGDGGGDELLL